MIIPQHILEFASTLYSKRDLDFCLILGSKIDHNEDCKLKVLDEMSVPRSSFQAFLMIWLRSFPAQLHDPLNLNLPPVMPPAAEDLYDDPADCLQVVAVLIFKYNLLPGFR